MSNVCWVLPYFISGKIIYPVFVQKASVVGTSTKFAFLLLPESVKAKSVSCTIITASVCILLHFKISYFKLTCFTNYFKFLTLLGDIILGSTRKPFTIMFAKTNKKDIMGWRGVTSQNLWVYNLSSPFSSSGPLKFHKSGVGITTGYVLRRNNYYT